MALVGGARRVTSTVMVHLQKLAVGIRDRAHLAAVQAARAAANPPLRHLTRHFPKRAAEIVEGGSLYWVIAGTMRVRQRILAITPARREDGSAGCAIHLDPQLVPIAARPVKAFQGWRYLAREQAPPDLPAGAEGDDLPPELAEALRSLALL
jgi:hypothetical protein